MTTLIVVRHGETDWNRMEKLQGRTDVPLNATGLLQAQALADVIATESINAIVSSPLKRAFSTAEVIAKRLGVPVSEIRLDDHLMERAYGAVEGMTIAERDAAYPGGVWPGAETYREIDARARGVLDEYAVTYRGQTACVVTHGGWIRAAMRVIAGRKSAAAGMQIPNTSCSWITHDGEGWHLGEIAVAAHLSE